MKKKEQEYKELIEKEVKMVIDSALKKDNNDSNHYGISYYHRDSDDFELDGKKDTFTREYFVSIPENVIVIYLKILIRKNFSGKKLSLILLIKQINLN